MGLFLKYVTQTKSGSFTYRRRVPLGAASVIQKREFKKKLGDTRKEALERYLEYHREVEEEIARALSSRSGEPEKPKSTQSNREQFERALRKLMQLLNDYPDCNRELLAESLTEKYELNAKGEPIGMPNEERHFVNLLRHSDGNYAPPNPTLGDALNLYLKEHLGGETDRADQKAVQFTNRVISAVVRVLGVDPALNALTRDNARNVRDAFLKRTKRTGRGIGQKVSPNTVSRELSIVSAVISFGIREFDLSGSVSNPFEKLTIKAASTKKDDEKRLPIPKAELGKIRARIMERSGKTQQLIWRLLEGTGCRLAEVTGALVEDMKVDHEYPHFVVKENTHRRLKTDTSRRLVPLVGDALDAAKEAVKFAGERKILFPEYCRQDGSTAASAVLMKQIRSVVSDERYVVHSLRHNMKDRLITAEVSEQLQNFILGHSVSGIGDKVYGGPLARLRAVYDAMEKAMLSKES